MSKSYRQHGDKRYWTPYPQMPKQTKVNDEISAPPRPMYDHDNPDALLEWEKLDMVAMDEAMGIKRETK